MAINILMVLDGDYRYDIPFAPAGKDFTFTTLVSTLQNAGMAVFKAHRDTDGSADESDFDFSSHDLGAYDLIWLIGHHGRNAFPIPSTASSGNHLLSTAELTAIENFMDAGGGVFATGDHDSIGADTGGHIKRVRAMRTWFGNGDGQGDTLPPGFPRNHDVVGLEQADTVQESSLSDYSGETQPFRYFENQSDSTPQPITPTTTPAHPILRHGGNNITIYPDHMHEGNTLGRDELEPFVDGGTLTDFPSLGGHTELPEVVATGQSFAQLSKFASGSFGGDFIDPVLPTPKTVNTLSAYDGRNVGVGRIVTGSTFHHYIDINLTGDTDIEPDTTATGEPVDLVGPDAVKGQGFGYPGAEATFDAIKAVYVNIAKWLARPRPAVQLILERSTFSQDECLAGGTFYAAFLVSVDGLKPGQFPAGGISTLSPSQAQLDAWAPSLNMEDDTGITITPTAVDSDDPSLLERVQRFTFTYRVTIDPGAAFGFAGETSPLHLDAALNASGVDDTLTDRAWVLLVKAANPFMLDLANGNETHWLSSDIRVFPVVAGDDKLGHSLPDDASPDDARAFLQTILGGISDAEFQNLPDRAADSALSPLPTTTGSGKNVYNFAIARVRLNGQAVDANNVRVFFRIFTTQTTAALTFRRTGGSTPIDGTPSAGYRQTGGANPIALPGETTGGSEWLSFPMFAAARNSTPSSQTDGDNVKSISPVPGNEVSTYFGALIDTNLDTPYLPPAPGSGEPPVGMATLLADIHQCIVAQIEYQGIPIPNLAKPSTSDKLAQRNIAMSPIANPGLEASRMALHTFEIDATPAPVNDSYWPDELLVDWSDKVPEGTLLSLFIPSWNAEEVINLANRFYNRHTLYATDEQTVVMPAGGIRYLPIPRHTSRQTGVMSVHFPIGVRKGQRFDVSVRQVTYRERIGRKPKYDGKTVSRRDAARLLAKMKGAPDSSEKTLPRGAFRIADDQVLITNPLYFDMRSSDPVLMTVPDKKEREKIARERGRWRETVGAFQIGIPVSDKESLRDEFLRIFSLLRWRADFIKPNSRWYTTFQHYLALMADKVRALGADPFAIDPSPAPVLPGGNDTDGGGKEEDVTKPDPFFEPGDDEWLGESSGLDDPKDSGARTFSGKVSGLLYDHFGDFEGFTMEDYRGRHLRFFSREKAILDIAQSAWLSRHVVTVITVSGTSRRVRRMLIRGYTRGD